MDRPRVQERGGAGIGHAAGAARERRNTIIARLRTLPGWADLASGRATVSDFRDLEVKDLLRRDPVAPNATLLARALAGQVGQTFCAALHRHGGAAKQHDGGLQALHRTGVAGVGSH